MDGFQESSSQEQRPAHTPNLKRFRFSLGSIYATPAALDVVSADEIQSALGRHCSGDWGEVSPEDWKANELSLEDGTRLLSSYKTAEGHTFWIITEADRASTTILLPADY